MRRIVSPTIITGVFFVAGYLLFTAGSVFYSLTCSGVFCGLTIVLPVMPWLFILEPILSNSAWSYFVIVVLNSVIFYLIGLYVGKLIDEREQRKEMREI